MKKSVLTQTDTQQLIERAHNLNPVTKANWGLMTATEMLVHCNLAHQGILKAAKSDKSATFRQLMFKFVFFHLRSEFPKLAKGPKRFQTAGNAPDASFEEEKSKFIHILSKFPKIDYALEASHPVFGPLTHQQWGIFVWRHVDHHLRQFGV